MQEVEHNFYEFVQQQIAKKHMKNKSKDSNQTKVIDEAVASKINVILDSNQVSDNVQKVVRQQKKRLKIDKISKEQQFSTKLGEFTSLPTFVDIKKFMGQLNSPRTSVPKGNKTKGYVQMESEEFDYQDVLEKSKVAIVKNLIWRTKPRVVRYYKEDIIQSKSIDEQKSDIDQFYTNIDTLITNIDHDQQNKELDKFYEVDRQRTRKFIQSLHHIQFEDSVHDETQRNAAEQGRIFKEKSKKVLQLLQKTTKQLYANKVKFYVAPKLKETDNSTINDQKSQSSIQLKKFNSIISLPTINIYKKPEEQYPMQTNLRQQRYYFQSLRLQMDVFLKKLDKTRKELVKMQPTDMQIVKIQNSMDRQMKNIGANDMEIMKYNPSVLINPKFRTQQH